MKFEHLPLPGLRPLLERAWRRIYWTSQRHRAEAKELSARSRVLAARITTVGGSPTFVDIGAAGGLSEGWRLLARDGLCRAFGIDPDTSFADGGQRDGTMYIEAAVGDRPETMELNVTLYPECSSVLTPNASVLKDYPARRLFEVVRRMPIKLTTVDEMRRSGALPDVDYLKIDVQGLELRVLRGARETLPQTTGIELEAHFRPLYVGQALLPEIVQYLRDQGFVLRDLRPQGPFEGEVVEVNAFFSRKRPEPDLMKLALWESVCRIPRARKLAGENLSPELKVYA